MIRRAEQHECDEVAAVVASAFADDPIMTYLIPAPSSDHRRERLQLFFGHLVARELSRTEHFVDVVESDDGAIVAAAVWSLLDVPHKPTPKELLRFAPVAMRVFRSRVPRALKVVGVMEQEHPSEPHRYLGFIGVNPNMQGKGWGGRLLASATAALDEQGLGAYLESSNPMNDALYARHGFVSRDRMPLPDGAPLMTPMWRDAR